MEVLRLLGRARERCCCCLGRARGEGPGGEVAEKLGGEAMVVERGVIRWSCFGDAGCCYMYDKL